MTEFRKRNYQFGKQAALGGFLFLLAGFLHAAEFKVMFDRTIPTFPNFVHGTSSGKQCAKPIAWGGQGEHPGLLLAVGKDYTKEPASDIRSMLIWQTFSADGTGNNEVLADVIGAGIEAGHVVSVKGLPVALIVDHASRVSLVKPTGSEKPAEVNSNEGIKIAEGSKAKLILAKDAIWLVAQQGTAVILHQYDESLNSRNSTKVKLALPFSAKLMDSVTRDVGKTIVLVFHELDPDVSLARVRLVTVESATGKVINTTSVVGFNPVAVAYKNEVYFSRVVVKRRSGKQVSEIWIGKLSADGKKVTEWRSHKQEFGTLFSSIAVDDHQVSLIGARGYRLFIKSFSKRGRALSEYQEIISKFKSPLFGYPTIIARNQLFVAQVYEGNEDRSICGDLRVIGLREGLNK